MGTEGAKRSVEAVLQTVFGLIVSVGIHMKSMRVP